jgi:molecular chaperone IbpA
MTHWKTYTFDSSNFDRFFIGADKLAKSLKEGSDWLANNAVASYPPFNLKKIDDNKYMIEMAVAGFTKQDIELTLEDNKLIIKGNASPLVVAAFAATTSAINIFGYVNRITA